MGLGILFCGRVGIVDVGVGVGVVVRMGCVVDGGEWI